MIDIRESIRIRPERSDEWGVVYQVVRDAFGRDEEADLVDKLRHTPEFVPELSLVALFHGGIIGYILFTDLCIKDGDPAVRSLALAPIAVHPGWQRKGIGSAMVNAGMEGCRVLGYECIVVVGDPGILFQVRVFTRSGVWSRMSLSRSR